jgi:predicted nucleotidyltransferase
LTFLTNFVKKYLIKVSSFAEEIKRYRLLSGEPLRVISQRLAIDMAVLSKIENGKRKATKNQVYKLAEYYGIKPEHLVISWLSDKLVTQLGEPDIAWPTLQAAEQKIGYLKYPKPDRKVVIGVLNSVLKQFDKIRKAWLFGSFARGEDNMSSDIDMVVETEPQMSYFELFEIQNIIQNILHRKIDIGFFDSLKKDILNKIKAELLFIYER